MKFHFTGELVQHAWEQKVCFFVKRLPRIMCNHAISTIFKVIKYLFMYRKHYWS
jgi:hypothetical protein